MSRLKGSKLNETQKHYVKGVLSYQQSISRCGVTENKLRQIYKKLTILGFSEQEQEDLVEM